jgi:accessory gene regulator protein AgrB
MRFVVPIPLWLCLIFVLIAAFIGVYVLAIVVILGFIYLNLPRFGGHTEKPV